MIVADASAMIEVLVGGDTDPALLDELTGDIAAPHVLDLEVLSVLRGLTLAGKLAPETADRALQEYFQLNIQRHSTALLAGRIWHLRYQFTAYDASYLALAEALGVHYQTVGYLERGEYSPSLHLALRIARFFEVPVESVFSLDDFPRLQ